MTDKKITFEKLTPEENIENIDYYEEALDFALYDKDVINIAVTGIYGAGKTSILESYKNKKSNNKIIKKNDYLHISLADFEKKEQSNENNSDENDSDNKDIDNKTLEGKILNQLLHQVDTKMIPQSIFKLKRNVSFCQILKPTIFIFIFILNLFLIWSFPEKSMSLIREATDFEVFDVFKSLNLIILVVQIGMIIYYIIKLQLNKKIFKGLSVRSKNIQSDIEIFEDSKDSYFDKYLDDVIYLFYNSGAKVIVFEDIDRFDNNIIFAKLKEINTLVNSRKDKDEKIKFIYMIKDDMFLSKDRTKFFDFILPIIPFINPSNSYDELKSLLEKQPNLNDTDVETLFELFDNNFLLKLSIYIDDMRLLKNIVNEFIIYYGRLNQLPLNVNKLFAFIVYKNIFPNDFAEIQLNRGFIYQLFQNKKEYIATEKKELTEKIDELTRRIEESKKEHLNSKYEVYSLFYTRKENYSSIQVNGKKANEFPDKSMFFEEIIKADYKVMAQRINNYQLIEIDLTKEFEEIEENPEFIQRIKIIKDKFETDSLREEIKDLKKEITKLSEKKLFEIITRKDIQNAEKKHFTDEEKQEKKTHQQIKKSSYFNLLVFLVTSGYIDEDYHSYITYFHEKSLTVDDNEFLRAVYDLNDSRNFPYDFKLKNLTEIYNRLDKQDFMKKEALNFKLFNHMLNEINLTNRTENLASYFKQMEQSNNTGFFIEFYIKNNFENRSEMLNQLIKNTPTFFKKLIQDDIFSKKARCELVSDALSIYNKDQLSILDNNNIIINFIQNSNLLLYQEKKYTKQFMENLRYWKVQFKKIKFDEICSKSLRDFIYKESLYAINIENISSILFTFYKKEDEEHILHKNYTLISGTESSSLRGYIEKNIDLYVQEYLKFSEGIILDDPEHVYSVLNNDDVESTNRVKYISALDQQKILLSKLETTDFYTRLIEENKLLINSENILIYFQFSDNKWLDELIEFVNLNEKQLNFKWPINKEILDNNLEDKFFNTTLIETEINDSVYQNILKGSKYIYRQGLPSQNLTEEKMKILIKLDIVGFSKDNLIELRQEYPDIIIYFITENLEEYLVLVKDSIVYNYDELLGVLESHKTSRMDVQREIINSIKEPISIKNKRYTAYVLNYILETKFNVEDLHYLIQHYKHYTKTTKQIILKIVLTPDHVNYIIEENIDLTTIILNKILDDINIDLEDRQLLFSRNIKDVERDQLKNIFESLMLNSFIKVVNENRRNTQFLINETHQNILKNLEMRELISSYKQEKNHYSVNSKQEKDLI